MAPFTYSPLLTDLYQLTMAYGYWRRKMHERESVFHLVYRSDPFKGHYALSAGLASVVEFLQQWRFQPDDLDYLATLKNPRHEALFPAEFLDYLSKLAFTCDLDAIPEGTIVFAEEPLIRIQGPLLQCQLLESPLLNIINFQTLIATKATRICRAAGKDEVIEFGLRRAQGPDGALSASRAAYIGGCVATSNTLAGKRYDIPVRGTHAHSWVTAFHDEEEAFTAYAEIMPNNCVLLVDTYDTIKGVKNAIKIGKKLKESDAKLLAVRLDSGDMADLSIKARQLLDEAGLKDTSILASNSLNETIITDLKQKGAKIDAWGVGTQLVTAYDQPALDGVYKLSALRDSNNEWAYKLKLSEQTIKISNPGRHQVRRFYDNGRYVADVIYDLSIGISQTRTAVLFNTNHDRIHLDGFDRYVDLLQPILRQGKLISPLPSIHDIRQNAITAIWQFDATQGEKAYPVGLEASFYEMKEALVQALS